MILDTYRDCGSLDILLIEIPACPGCASEPVYFIVEGVEASKVHDLLDSRRNVMSFLTACWSQKLHYQRYHMLRDARDAFNKRKG